MIPTLELIAGMNDFQETRIEAYLVESKDCDFIRMEVSSETTNTFQLDLYNPEKEPLGKLEFDNEQAHFLHSWLTSYLFFENSKNQKNLKQND